MSDTSLELVSFKVCPFVQRSVIALNEKNVDFKLTHIMPGNEPDWFKEVSPLGKVPVLLVGGQPVFESAVISEYLDEMYTPTLHPADPLAKARHRSWIEFCSDLISTQFRMVTAPDQEAYESNLKQLKEGLARVGENLSEQAPFFSGEQMALVDTTYAPLFMRMAIVERVFKVDFAMSERVRAWSDALLAKDSVKTSVVGNFEEVFMMFLKKQDGYMVNNL
uniref:glutathione transferase n=1 Tax=uncultured Thiotrichaceae bacterium TaxID=298394 RepID=A0A6S6TWK5_9GAMM|nr:MAG: Glutathione S-transferase [uncultured Thiotrichaceae bacterium]